MRTDLRERSDGISECLSEAVKRPYTGFMRYRRCLGKVMEEIWSMRQIMALELILKKEVNWYENWLSWICKVSKWE